MCGFIGFSGNLDNKEAILQKMMDRIVHRGPDMGDMYTDDGIALGFRRLSILDLSDAGAQPMANEDKSGGSLRPKATRSTVAPTPRCSSTATRNTARS